MGLSCADLSYTTSSSSDVKEQDRSTTTGEKPFLEGLKIDLKIFYILEPQHTLSQTEVYRNTPVYLGKFHWEIYILETDYVFLFTEYLQNLFQQKSLKISCILQGAPNRCLISIVKSRTKGIFSKLTKISLSMS